MKIEGWSEYGWNVWIMDKTKDWDSPIIVFTGAVNIGNFIGYETYLGTVNKYSREWTTRVSISTRLLSSKMAIDVAKAYMRQNNDDSKVKEEYDRRFRKSLVEDNKITLTKIGKGRLGVSEQDRFEFYRRMGEISPEYEDPEKQCIPERCLLYGSKKEFNAVEKTFLAYQSGLGVILAGGIRNFKFAQAICNALTDYIWETLSYNNLNITGSLEPKDILGEWDYQAQANYLNASKIKVGNPKALTDEEIVKLKETVYTMDNFKFGHLSLCMIQGVPILIDEVNRSSIDIQNILLQLMEENEIVTPGIGRIRAISGFFMVCIIGERDIGKMEFALEFLRRFVYLGFDEPMKYIKGEKLVKKGDRIELKHTNDAYTKLKKGDKGIITDINYVRSGAGFNQIIADWDKGSKLILIEGEDIYKIIAE